MNCPTSETLERLALGFLEDEVPVRAHVGGCPECVRRLEALAPEHAALSRAAKAVRLPRVRIQPPAGRRLLLPLAACVLVGLVFVGAATLMVGDRAPMASPPKAWSVNNWEGGDHSGVLVEGRHYKEVEGGRRISGERVDETIRKGISTLKVEPAAVSAPSPATTPEPPPPPKLEPPAERPADMFFKDVGVNPTIDTAKETLSTFALDVDTASYTLARNYLRRGQLPPREAIRVEEFVNYFDYADAPPPAGAFAVHLEAAPSPFDADRHLVRVAVVSRPVRARERKDAVLTFVVDVSGSMAQENRLGLVKRSLRYLVDKLRPSDRIGVVVYGTYARKLLDPTPVSRKDAILGVIEELHPEGSTNAGAGLETGYELAAGAFDAGKTNRVILCSDGVANTGVTDPEAILRRIKEHASKGILLSTLGFGMGNYNDALMEKLADSGNGNYAYIDDFEEAKKTFGEKLAAMMEVVAEDAKVQVEFDPATVASFRQIGYENRRLAHKDFRNDKADAGEVGPGHRVTALYEVSLRPDAGGRLVQARVRYREPGTKEVVEMPPASLGRAQVRETAGSATASFRLAAAVAQFAEVLRESPRAKGVALGTVLKEAEGAVRDLDRPADAVEFLEILKLARQLGK